METGSPVSDVGSNILPQSEMGKQSFRRHWHLFIGQKQPFLGESLSNVIHY